MVFADFHESITIKNGDLSNVIKIKEKYYEIENQWKTAITQIYGFSSDATLLKGPKLKYFYHAIAEKKDKKYLANFREIIKT
jgi:hypothetical protein